MTFTPLSRRRTLACVGAVAAGLAGCAETDDRATTDTATTGAGDTASADLNLREANVVAVTVETEGGNGDYRFEVTLIHDDDGENGYADWWQVETLAGGRLGRRELAHPHGTREFTRSTTVSIPEGTTCVVVRGHDQTHDYGGQAMLVRVETGGETAVRQGPERRSVADRAC
ncbi:hypothetical protein [Haloplanus sp.]|uniref:hypothetical protein n=1 Tax=Haloplanus sp. TaxID=1961696 RepID=UPI00261BB7EE|nr:hypothetical protein [Haloplanus sp.]